MHLGESPREGVARELEAETGLAVDPDDLVYVCDEAGEPAAEQYMVGIDYAVWRSDTADTLRAGSDATEGRYFSPAEFSASEHALKHTHVDRFGPDSISCLLNLARERLGQ
jgi:ADP-ribose pyrophosphatase YjhB (NUDIX family)